MRATFCVAFLCFFLAGCGAIDTIKDTNITFGNQFKPSSYELPEGTKKADAQITNTLIFLLENKDKFKVDLTSVEGTPLGDMLTVGSPIGYKIRNRYLNIGVPLSEALALNADPIFRERLVTLARWDKGEVRSAALVALASAKDLAHLDIFREALVHLDPAIRFAAMEALTLWGHPEMARPLLFAAADKDYEPILRVYAAAGLASLGDKRGVRKLRVFLDHSSWLVKAMAGRYLGDYGTAKDYHTLVGRIGREQVNDFVVAEYCIAALKLWGKYRS